MTDFVVIIAQNVVIVPFFVVIIALNVVIIVHFVVIRYFSGVLLHV